MCTFVANLNPPITMKIRFLIFTLFAFAFTLPPADVKIQYEFKIGDEYTWVQTTKQTIKQSVMGTEQIVDNVYEGAFSLKVVALTSTGAKIETQFTRLKNSTKSPMGSSEMDSEGATESMENKVFKSMVNKSFFVFMNRRGQIEKLEGTDNLWSGFSSLGLDEAREKAMKQALDQVAGESSLKANLEQVLVAYPDKKLKQGESWKTSGSLPMNFPVTLENTWNIDQLSATEANLSGDGVYFTNDKAKTIELPGGFKAKADLAGKQAMKSKVNVKSGWPTKLDVLSELKGKMIILAGGMIPEDMDIPMEILTETSYVITKK
jgi:hypothetical protein